MANWGKILSRGNVEDRRGFGPVGMGLGGLGIGGIALIMLANVLLGGDAGDVLGQLEQIPIETQQNVNSEQFQGEDSYEVFTSTVLGSNNAMWEEVFNKANATYSPPKLVLFRNATTSGCGVATSEVGPHYCPLDQTIYLDETFFEELETRFGAQGGDVAEAYVIAHETAHHAQNMFGIMDTAKQSNDDSIKLELQADCFAGLWAHSIRNAQVLEPGEIQEAMDAAAAVGDDRIQKRVNGQINPETWTHGSSGERVAWFNRGYESGSLDACDTFKN